MNAILDTIPWHTLPDVPRITLDYFDGRPEAVNLLGGDWRDRRTRELILRHRLDFHRPNGLAEAVSAGYEGSHISEAVRKNIDYLNRPETVAVVTGQQVGLFGGPLYTFYKAFTTIQLAGMLAEEWATPVVPIFWMETTDADFGEVNRIGFPPDDTYPRRAVYTPHDIIAGRPVRFHILTDEIVAVIDKTAEWLRELPDGARIERLLRESYRPGNSMAGAFRNLLNELLGKMGLIILDPLAPEIVSLTRPFWRQVTETPHRFNNAYSVTSRELESLRHPLQVRLRDDTLPIFYIDSDGVRRRIHADDKSWWFSGSGEEKFVMSDLRALVEEEHSCLAPSVLMRPLMQDWLLPSVAYVAGPAEIAYHAQIGRSYPVLGVPRPMIVPRYSATILEVNSIRWLERHGWTAGEVIAGREMLMRRTGRSDLFKEIFENGKLQLNGFYERISRSSEEAGINLHNELDAAMRKIGHQWDKLQRIGLQKLFERDKTRALHAEKLLGRLLPDEVLQERHHSALYYLAAFGDELMNQLKRSLDPFNPMHLVTKLERTQ